MKSTTIIDVAKKAQVSVATVSRVVNGNYPVKEATKKKVLEAIKPVYKKRYRLTKIFNTLNYPSISCFLIKKMNLNINSQ